VAAGHEVKLVLPCYGSLDLTQWSPREIDSFDVLSVDGIEHVKLIEVALPGSVTGLLVKSDRYFGGISVYSENDCGRYYLFCRVVLSWLLRTDWKPDVVHCHDWHTALLPMWLRMGRHPYATVFTIHNLHYQGGFQEDFLWKAGLQDDWRFTPSGAPYLPFNFIARGILWADMLTAVSSTYAEEIASPEGGAGMDSLLRFRQASLKGILNGLDTSEYDPAKDKYLRSRYDRQSIDRRVLNKANLQMVAGLSREPGMMVAGMVGRLEDQKGLDLLERTLEGLMQLNLQLVVVGRGRLRYEDLLRGLSVRYPGRAVGRVGFENEFSHLIYGGADVFLMPSLYEPCGLGQMIAMRYGAIPVVRRTGGLAETVPDAGADIKHGRGFVFEDYRSEAFRGAIVRAVDAWKLKSDWRALMLRAMSADFSWELAAQKYMEVYQQALEGMRNG
jgi:starch synthase